MFRHTVHFVFAAALLLSSAAIANSIKLKLSFFTSDRSLIYQSMVKPFVDAVNAEGEGIVKIDVYFSGAISAVQSQQPQLVSDGTADLAIFTPGQTPGRFPDTAVLELPGLFKNSTEASRVYARMAASGALAGYQHYYIVGAFVSGFEEIYSRTPINSVGDLKGLKIRVNNAIEAEVLERLGAIPVLLAINNTTEAVSRGAIDGATLPPSMLFQFGIGRAAANDYMIRLGGVAVVLVMNRKKFESLPAAAQAIIRKHSGETFSAAASKQLAAQDNEVLHQLEGDPRRKVVFPSAADEKAIQAAFNAVTAEYAESSTHDRDLLDAVRRETAKVRGSE